MAVSTLRLRHSDMLRAIEEIDLIDLVAHELLGRVTGTGDRRPAGRPAAHPDVAVTAELTSVVDPDSGRICLMPTPSLRMISLAGLAGLAARELLPPGVVTATVFGSGAAARLQLWLVARHIPNVSHVAVYPGVAETERPAEWNVHDGLELAGITLSISTDARHAALGANLLVVAELGWDRLDVGHLRSGVLVINVAGRDLPDELLAEVDRVYVDDIELLERNQHRTFVRLHFAGSGTRPDPTYQYREGWFRRQPLWRHQRRIDTDLVHMLSAGHRRTDVDEVLLVELLGAETLGVWLAGHIYRAAAALDLGSEVNNSRTE